MLLSQTDIELLTRIGYAENDFVRNDREGFAKLRNRHGHCFFYDPEEHSCRVYESKPSGCSIYPVVYSIEEGIVVDGLCQAKDTISASEMRCKGTRLVKLLKTIDSEAAKRKRLG